MTPKQIDGLATLFIMSFWLGPILYVVIEVYWSRWQNRRLKRQRQKRFKANHDAIKIRAGLAKMRNP